MKMVEIVLNLVKVSREGNWQMHLATTHDMIPWCFSYDRINYARYLSSYYADVAHLNEGHPDVKQYLEAGGFSVQQSDKSPFGKVPADQTVEETVNHDTHTAEGTKGFSFKPAAIQRYYLTAEVHVCKH